MAMDDLFAAGGVFALALDCGDDPIAFLHLVPSPAGGGYSLSSQRRLPGSPGGISEFLIVEALGLGARGGRARALAQTSVPSAACCTSTGRTSDCYDGLARGTLLRLDVIFQIERLRTFSHKFRPQWRPRYAVSSV